MGKSLYILKEFSEQEEYKTAVKYLYSSKLNSNLVTLMESMNADYIYLSYPHGILQPNEELEPYKIKVLYGKKLKLWSLLNAEYIHRYCKENEIDTIVQMFSGNYFTELNNRLVYLGYTIETPLRYFKTRELKNRWVLHKINEQVCKNIIN